MTIKFACSNAPTNNGKNTIRFVIIGLRRKEIIKTVFSGLFDINQSAHSQAHSRSQTP